MSETSKMHFSINVNEEVSVVRKKIYRTDGMPNYRRIGIMKNDDNKDILDILGEVSKTAYKMYLNLKEGRDEDTNLSSLPATEDHSDTVIQNKALRELIQAGLIKKVKTTALKGYNLDEVRVEKRTYIINPSHLFPRTNEGFELALFYWEQLK